LSRAGICFDDHVADQGIICIGGDECFSRMGVFEKKLPAPVVDAGRPFSVRA
jgi:hypothetical protein